MTEIIPVLQQSGLDVVSPPLLKVALANVWVTSALDCSVHGHKETLQCLLHSVLSWRGAMTYWSWFRLCMTSGDGAQH